MAQANIPPFVQDFLRTGFHGSHFCVGKGNDNVYLTTAGTIPGSPLADIVFQLALVRFHHNLQRRLRERNLLVTIESPSTCKASGTTVVLEASTSTWVDDLAVVVSSSTAAGLVPQLASVAAVVEQSLCSTGVLVNYSPGKTAAMCFFRGKGARTVKKLWMIEQQGRVQLPRGPGQGKFLQLITEYTHLGNRWHASGQQVVAIAHRLSIAKPIFSALRKRLLFNSCLTCSEKVRLVVQGPLASLLHGSGLWVVTDRPTARRAHEAIANMYRQCVRPILNISCRGLTDTEVCCALVVLQPADVLKFQRMRTVLSVAPLVDGYLVAALSQECTWISLVIADWASFHELACPVVPSCEHFEPVQVQQFFEWIRDNCGPFKLKLKDLIKQQLRKLEASSELVMHKARLLDGVFVHHAISWRQPGTLAGVLPRVVCPECHQVVRGQAALAAHRSKTHGVSSLGALLHDHTMCPVCLVEFWSPTRLWDHMRKSPHCKCVFEASDLDLLPTRKTRGIACDLPAVRLQGPVEWWATLRPSTVVEGHRPPSGDVQTRVRIAWADFCVGFPNDADLAAQALRVHTLWREVLCALHVCDGSLNLPDPLLGPAQYELTKLLKACEGLSITFRGFVLVSFDDHFWIVPSQARANLARFIAFSLHDEFTSPQLL